MFSVCDKCGETCCVRCVEETFESGDCPRCVMNSDLLMQNPLENTSTGSGSSRVKEEKEEEPDQVPGVAFVPLKPTAKKAALAKRAASVPKPKTVFSGQLLMADLLADQEKRRLAPKESPPESGGRLRELIRGVYQRHNPAKLGDVESLLQKYRGMEAELYTKVCEKYGEQIQELESRSPSCERNDSRSPIRRRSSTIFHHGRPEAPRGEGSQAPASAFRSSEQSRGQTRREPEGTVVARRTIMPTGSDRPWIEEEIELPLEDEGETDSQEELVFEAEPESEDETGRRAAYESPSSETRKPKKKRRRRGRKKTPRGSVRLGFSRVVVSAAALAGVAEAALPSRGLFEAFFVTFMGMFGYRASLDTYEGVVQRVGAVADEVAAQGIEAAQKVGRVAQVATGLLLVVVVVWTSLKVKFLLSGRNLEANVDANGSARPSITDRAEHFKGRLQGRHARSPEALSPQLRARGVSQPAVADPAGFPSTKVGFAQMPSQALALDGCLSIREMNLEQRRAVTRFVALQLKPLQEGRLWGLKVAAGWGVGMRGIAHQLAASAGLMHESVDTGQGKEMRIWKPGKDGGCANREAARRRAATPVTDRRTAGGTPGRPQSAGTPEFHSPESLKVYGGAAQPAVPAFPFPAGAQADAAGPSGQSSSHGASLVSWIPGLGRSSEEMVEKKLLTEALERCRDLEDEVRLSQAREESLHEQLQRQMESGPALRAFDSWVSEFVAKSAEWKPEDGPVRFISFTFGDHEITNCLLKLCEKGVRVQGVLDSGNYTSCDAGQQMVWDLVQAGAEVRIGKGRSLKHAYSRINAETTRRGLIHAKGVCMGEELLWTGSFNLSSSSRANVDLMIRLTGPVIRDFLVIWQQTFDACSAPALPAARPEVRRRMSGKQIPKAATDG